MPQRRRLKPRHHVRGSNHGQVLVFKQMAQHMENCSALRHAKAGDWTTPWYVPNNSPVQYRDKLGRNNGGFTRWVMVRCNDSRCLAWCLVKENSILEGLPHE